MYLITLSETKVTLFPKKSQHLIYGSGKMEFASFLEKQLSVRKITINRLSSETGVSRQSLYRWLAGENYPDAKHVITIGKVLALSNEDVRIMLKSWIKDNELGELFKLYIESSLIQPLNLN